MSVLKDTKVLLTCLSTADRERCTRHVQALGGRIVTGVVAHDLPHVVVTTKWATEKVKASEGVQGKGDGTLGTALAAATAQAELAQPHRTRWVALLLRPTACIPTWEGHRAYRCRPLAARRRCAGPARDTLRC